MPENKQNQLPGHLGNPAGPDREDFAEIADFCGDEDLWLAFSPEDEIDPLPDVGDFWIEPD